MIDTGGVHFTQHPGPTKQLEGGKSPQGLQGKLQGEGLVATSNAASKFADAAEEMSFIAGQFKNKTSDKRKFKTGSGLSASILERIKKIQTIQGVQGVKDLLNNFQTQKNLTNQQIREKLEEFSDDPVDQFTALDIAADYFEQLGDKQKADQLRGVRDDIRAEHKSLITAAANISEDAAEFSHFGDVRGIREAYDSNVQSYVRDDQSLEKLHQFLTENYGTDDIEEAILMQLKLLSSEMASMEPSAPPEHLDAIVKDLSKLKQLVAIHDSCIETEEQLVRTYPETELNEDVLMRQLLNLVQQQWVTEADFEKIPDAMNVQQLDAQIFTLTKVVAMVRMIPEEVFANDDTKQAIISAASEGLDSKIEMEATEDIANSQKEAESFISEIAIDLSSVKRRHED
ncbi:TyeA family type III secretion system gatekeeper subunit [Endozoicomonas gorgoniicola]|uniref:TyeA family type III secretion system gatekeeper subunit n=1 Tax=Endozoicomonas gorgoniicola TaxID=1234144 RepID=A0ABT3N3X8_9GAMM|nr:TyeA family type III secretion system gatekeeper subunit [Endozoicomonas gorgoniicola]MCW7556340.1 TyeA family type III secretion system gatekeeper subunit [Endozoicomonas gorgoniicola]